MSVQTSSRAAGFTESVIREMTRVCSQEKGINLAQGYPDFAAPALMKEAAKRAIDADHNQYSITWGSSSLRQAIARRTSEYNGIPTDPERQVTVCCGATECMIATLLALLNPGDEVVIFEPFYENYGPDCLLSGAIPRYVRLREPDWSFAPEELAAAFGPKTRAIIVNTPHNPTGKVFTTAELEIIADLCRRHDAVCITDEIYEYILYGAAMHVSIASLAGMEDRTVTISGLSKTWSATGWRIGWCVAPDEISLAIRKVHDFLTVGAAAPLQEAAAEALAFGSDYFESLRRDYETRRETLLSVLEETGFRAYSPEGAYYIMTDVSDLQVDGESDVEFAHRLVCNGGVATVPGSSFFDHGNDGRQLVRFCFAKRIETLEAAVAVLRERLG